MLKLLSITAVGIVLLIVLFDSNDNHHDTI